MTNRDAGCILLLLSALAALGGSLLIDMRADQTMQDARSLLARAEKLTRAVEQATPCSVEQLPEDKIISK